MPDAIAIAFEHISKVYRMYNSIPDQALDVLGLSWLRPWRRNSYTEFPALTEINLKVRKGERIGIVGRNGAGKTTLLKLITGNFAPTSGEVRVNGTVQALMHVGLGFHPEFTGYENIRSALAYSGLSRSDMEAAINDVIDFVELDEFLHQPMKTYSMGMQARLMFAAATAIRPDILIIDEILGAGDAYFSGKSAHRMEKLAYSGCTLLLVSHSLQQILQFCDKAIWIEKGRIVMEDEALAVVKAYEEFTQRLQYEARKRQDEAKKQQQKVTISGNGATSSPLESRWLREKLLEQVLGATKDSVENGMNVAVSPGNISRWASEGGLRIERIRLLDDRGEELRVVHTGSPLDIEIEFTAEKRDDYTCFYVILLFTEDGRWLSRHCSESDRFNMACGERRKVRLKYPKILLGNGRYFFSAALYRELDLQRVNSARCYDLLSRSFEFTVKDHYPDDQTLFHHPASWVSVE